MSDRPVSAVSGAEVISRRRLKARRVGCAAGFSGDRTDAASPVVDALIAAGTPAVLIFETLAERTLALAQLAMRSDPDAGYEPLLVELLQPVLARCLDAGVRIVSNFGAANPAGAARRILALASELGLRRPRIAVVEGDDLSGTAHRPLLDSALGTRLRELKVVSANAYIGGLLRWASEERVETRSLGRHVEELQGTPPGLAVRSTSAQIACTSAAHSSSSSRVVAKIRPLGSAPTQCPERPTRCRATAMERGEPIWQTRSTLPISMPNSSDAVATTAFSSPFFRRVSASRRSARERLP